MGQEVRIVLRTGPPAARVKIEQMDPGGAGAANLMIGSTTQFDKGVGAGMVIEILVCMCGARRTILQLARGLITDRVLDRVTDAVPSQSIQTEDVNFVTEVAIVSATKDDVATASSVRVAKAPTFQSSRTAACPSTAE